MPEPWSTVTSVPNWIRLPAAGETSLAVAALACVLGAFRTTDAACLCCSAGEMRRAGCTRRMVSADIVRRLGDG
jgi:hypothetical protein